MARKKAPVTQRIREMRAARIDPDVIARKLRITRQRVVNLRWADANRDKLRKINREWMQAKRANPAYWAAELAAFTERRKARRTAP